MCEPVSIMTGLGIASSALGAYGAIEQASAQRATLANQRRLQGEETRTQKSLEAGERVKAARAERARLRVAAGEAGVAGVSFEDLLYDTHFQQEQDVSIIEKDASFAQRASDARYRSESARAAGPSALAAGLSIAASGYRGYSSGLQIADTRNRVTRSR